MDKTLYYMQKAIEQAEIAAAEKEVPVGSVISACSIAFCI